MSRVFLIFLLAVSTLACKDDCPGPRNCIEKVLMENNMSPYNGEEIGCNGHLLLYDLRGEQYFLLVNHCADMVSYPFDCDGNKLCEQGDNHTCTDFYENGKYIGIVGI